MKQIVNELSNGYAADIKPMELTESQELALSRMSRLVVGATYLFPAQIFHAKPTENSATGFSNRAACYEIADDGSITGIKTLSYSALRAAYLGRVTADAEIPVIEAEEREGLKRAKAGQASFVSNIKGGQAPIQKLEKDGKKTAIITAPFALKVTGRGEFYTTILERRDDGRYDMQVDANGNLAITSRNDYEFDYVVPTKEMLESINPVKDMPELSSKGFIL